MSLSEDQLHTLNLMVNQVNNIQDTLPVQLESIHKSINEFQGRLTHIETQLQDVYGQLRHQRSNPQTNIKIRLPTPFSGQSSLCNTFFSQLSLYFAGNLDYDTGEKKILLATSCLNGPAYAYMEPFLGKLNSPDKPEVLTNYQAFVDTITAAFGDSDPTMSAELALRRLRQSSSATSYATEFRRLSSLVSWNNAALVSQYKVNLRDAIQDELARRPVIHDLEELIVESIDIDNRLFQRQRSRRFVQPPPSYPVDTSRPPPPTAMDIDRAASNPSRQIPQDERNRRNQDKACYYCGVSGHFSNQCPAKRPNSTRQMVSTIIMGEPSPATSSIHALRMDPPYTTSTPSPSVQRDDLHCVHIRYEHDATNMILLPVCIDGTGHNRHQLIMALVDTGATVSIISKALVNKLQLQVIPHATGTSPLTVADGSTASSSGTCLTKMRLANTTHHREDISFVVMDNCDRSIILGLDWFRKHNVNIDFAAGTTLLHCNTAICCAPDPNVNTDDCALSYPDYYSPVGVKQELTPSNEYPTLNKETSPY